MPKITMLGDREAAGSRQANLSGRARTVNLRSGDSPSRRRLKGLLAEQAGDVRFATPETPLSRSPFTDRLKPKLLRKKG